MSSSTNLDTLVSKSLFVSLMRSCTNLKGPDKVIKNTKSGKTVNPARINDMKVITPLFVSVMPFTGMS